MADMQEVKGNNRVYKTTAYTFTGDSGKRDSIIVVAQLSPDFTARLVDRWQELEEQLGKQGVIEFPPMEEKSPAGAHRHSLKSAVVISRRRLGSVTEMYFGIFVSWFLICTSMAQIRTIRKFKDLR